MKIKTLTLSTEMTFDLDRVHRQESKLKNLFKEYTLVQSERALKVAKKYHIGQRKNGYAEISHQYEIVSSVIPLFLKYDREILDSLVAGLLLHDTVEDYPEKYNFANLKNDFNDIVFDIVKRMTKTQSFKKTQKFYTKYYKKLSKSPLSVMAKLFDRVHNYESMVDQNVEFKSKYFEEVETYMIPMAKKARKEFPEYEQVITFLIRQLKVLSHFHMKVMEARGEIN
jgi:hypothetical protein